MFDQVLQTLQQSDQDTIDRFLPRLKTIEHEAEGIGWGYYDAIYDTLEDAFLEGVYVSGSIAIGIPKTRQQ